MIAFDPTVVAAPAPQEMFTGGMTEGLRTEEIHHRLIRFGPNVRPETCANRWKIAISKFWAPAPWMLELAIIFQVGLGTYGEAAVIGGLPLLNGILGVRQEGRAQASLDALQARPALTASARRDGTWRIVPAVDLVPGDRHRKAVPGARGCRRYAVAGRRDAAGSIDADRRVPAGGD